MRNIKDLSLKLLSKTVAVISLALVSVATGTISLAGVYEPEMPAVLRPKDEENA
jgi:cyclic lactone autoinducer peptide